VTQSEDMMQGLGQGEDTRSPLPSVRPSFGNLALFREPIREIPEDLEPLILFAVDLGVSHIKIT